MERRQERKGEANIGPGHDQMYDSQHQKLQHIEQAKAVAPDRDDHQQCAGHLSGQAEPIAGGPAEVSFLEGSPNRWDEGVDESKKHPENEQTEETENGGGTAQDGLPGCPTRFQFRAIEFDRPIGWGIHAPATKDGTYLVILLSKFHSNM